MPDAKVTAVINAKDNATGVLQKFGGTLKSVGVVAAGAFVAGIGVKAVKAAADFEAALGNVNTLFDDSGESVAALEDGIKDLLKRVPKSADELGAAAYQIVSAGVSDTAEALNVLEASAKLGTAGLATTEEAADLLTSALNAFQISADQADSVADVLFKTVKAGKTTVAELSQSFGMVAPVAATLGVTLEELQSTTAALTTTGLKTSVAQNQLRAVFNNLLKPGTDLKEALEGLGIENINAAVSAEGFIPILQDLKSSVDGNEVAFGNLFTSVEAAGAALSLTGAAADTEEKIFNTLGSATNKLEEAFKKQTQTATAQWAILKNNLNVVLIQLGSVILPVINSALQPIIKAIQELSAWFDNLTGSGTSLIDKIKEAITTFDVTTGVVTFLREQFEATWTTVVDLLQPAIDDLIAVFKENEDQIMLVANALGTVLKVALGAVIITLRVLITVAAAVLSGFMSITAYFTDIGFKIWDSFNDKLASVINFFQKIIDMAKKVKDAIASIDIGGTLASLRGKVSGLLEFSSGGLVPGMLGSPQLAIVHGGERVLPAQGLRGRGVGSVSVNISGNTISSDVDVDRMAELIQEKIMDSLEASQLI